MSSEKLLYKALRTDDSDEESFDATEHLLSAARAWRLRFFALLALSSVLLSALLFLLLNDTDQEPCLLDGRGTSLPYCLFTMPSDRSPVLAADGVPLAPATAYISYTNKWLHHDPSSAHFMGEPRPEVDEAWHDLLQGTTIHVSEEEISNINNATSVRYKPGGYVAGLGISHNLHCLKRIKQYMHPDYYYNHEEQDWEELQKHAEHCLESIRQSVTCLPDLSLYTFEWTPHSRVKPTVRVPQAHSCVDWPKLHGWMLDRAAVREDMEPPPEELYEKK